MITIGAGIFPKTYWLSKVHKYATILQILQIGMASGK